MALGKILREFGVKIALNFSKAEAQKAQKDIKAVASDMKSLAKEVSIASAALIGMATISAKNSFALDTQSKQLGVSTTALQELEYAAKVAAGVSREELGGALSDLSKTMFEAQNNASEAGQAFIRLGVASTDELAKGTIKADVLLKRLADRFAQMPDGVAKTGLAASVGMERLLPLLNKGSQGIGDLSKEAHALGVVLDGTMIKEGVKFNQSLESIWAVLKNITFLIGGELIKYLQPIALEFQKWIVVNRKFIASGIATAMKQLGLYLGIVFKVAKALFGLFKAITEVMGGLERVAKMLALTMGFFASVRLISGVLTVVKSFRALGLVFGAMSGPIGLISAALVALILIVQDLFADDSIIKEWMGVFEKKFPTIAKIIMGVFTTIKDSISGMVSSIGEFLGSIGDLVKGVGSLGDVAKKAFSAFGAIAKASPLGLMAQGAGAAYDYFAGNQNATTATPSVAGSTTNAPTNNMNATINVQVPPGTGAKAASEIVASGVEDGFSSMLRNTRNQALGGVAY